MIDVEIINAESKIKIGQMLMKIVSSQLNPKLK